jgi:hypothetical protein
MPQQQQTSLDMNDPNVIQLMQQQYMQLMQQ